MDKSDRPIGQGGDGGSVVIIAREIKGEGKITADGGEGFPGGKGGQIHLITEKNTFTGELSAKGGATTPIPSLVQVSGSRSRVVRFLMNPWTITIIGGVIVLLVGSVLLHAAN